MQTHKSKVLIIGSGPAGYTAAIYAARANLAPILVTGPQPGGQLTVTADVENFPGFISGGTGPDLMMDMREQALKVGTTVIEDIVSFVDLSSSPVRAAGESGDIFVGDALIIATGAQARWLNIPGERELQGRGVSGCAICDGIFFRDKVVAVIGGGDSAVEEALYLSSFAKKVVLVHRRDALRAERVLQDRLFSRSNVELVWDTEITEVIGAEIGRVSGVKAHNLKTEETVEIALDGVFVAIGHSPSSAIFEGQVKTDDDGYIVVGQNSTQTNIPWVYSCGDVSDRKWRQAITAAAMGCMAALEVEKYLWED